MDGARLGVRGFAGTGKEVYKQEMNADRSTYGRRRRSLEALYEAMLASFGPSGWWPARTPFEVALGAILTQNTAWANVDKALSALAAVTGLIPDRVCALSPGELEAVIRPAGYFRQKSRKLRNFLCLMEAHGGLGHGERDASLACFAGIDDERLRQMLLGVSGIGPETADCILLYALERPFFVVDAYTRRILHRHGLVGEEIDYAALQDFFMDALPHDVALFNEYHALLVRTGKDFCRKARPRCGQCPLAPFLEYEP